MADNDKNIDSSTGQDNISEQEMAAKADNKKIKKHLIRPKWLRVILKTLMWIVIFILMIPVLVYLPPVQDLAISIAKKEVKKSTGMDIGIGKFRLKFPLNVELRDVYVLTAERDTMVRAGAAVADVKLLPLLSLDLQLNKLDLERGYFRMVSPDSSLFLSVNAGLLTVDDKSSMNLKNMHLLLNRAKLKDGKLNLYMNVWNKDTTQQDATSSSVPFLINANDLELENFQFGMSMLPTIDTLDMAVKHVYLKNGVVDLGKNIVSWRLAKVADGDVRYIQPTAEYIKTHPAPPSQPSTGPPMQIKGDSISVVNLKATYATRGANPVAGFDPSYIEVSDVAISMKDFYNESSTVRLPLTLLEARERSGLQIVEGHGLIGVDSVGLTIGDVTIKTLYSSLYADASVPFALMSLNPEATMTAKANGKIGIPDVEAFMPALRGYTAKIPARKPLAFEVDADGSLANIQIRKLMAQMKGVVDIQAVGYAKNALNYKQMDAKVRFDGALMDPSLAEKFLPPGEMKIPVFNINGVAEAHGLAYSADIDLRSTAGDLAANGKVNVTPEKYDVKASFNRINVAQFVPSIGIGHVTGSVAAQGAGFNPLSGKAVTDVAVRIDGIEYNKKNFKDIKADVTLLPSGDLKLLLSSVNPGLNLDVDALGTIKKDDYTVNMTAHINDLDLRALGLSDSVNGGHGTIYLNGTAQPERWNYDAEVQLVDFDWNLPDRFIHLPNGLTAKIKADDISTWVNIDSYLTNINFDSRQGLKSVIDSFIATSDTIMQQIDSKNIKMDVLSRTMPQFNLTLNAAGRGLLNQVIGMDGFGIDTIAATLSKDSLFTGDVKVMDLQASGIALDTIKLNLSERGKLLDYKLHVGNRPGTLDEFAQVNVNGYLGENRLGLFLNQRNIKNEMGYKLGLTAAMQDSIVTVHLTPLKATIAYLPWTINNDNYVDVNLKNLTLDANLMASSSESSILMKTLPQHDGSQELQVKIDNLKIEQFLNMYSMAPPITAAVNTDLHINYNAGRLRGGGDVGVKDFTYDKVKVGDFDLKLIAGYGIKAGDTKVGAKLNINGEPAIMGYAILSNDESGKLSPDSIGLKLTRFPLKVANPFLGQYVSLNGFVNGDMRMDGSFTKPRLNGYIAMDSVSVNIPIAAATLRLNESPIKVENNLLTIDEFGIYGANNNPLMINGTVDASKFNDLQFNLRADAKNFQVINTDNRSKGDIFGKIFLDINASVKGPMRLLDVNGNVNLLGTTDATYRLNIPESEMTMTNNEDVVKFVNFNDTTQVAAADSIEVSPLNMKIDGHLVISPGTQLEVLLSSNGTDKVTLQPTANLHYLQNYMGDMSLNGTLTLGEGFARYSLPVMGEKMFDFDPNSTVTFTGNVLNPTFNITATDNMKANVTANGNSRLVNFLVTLHATQTLENLKLAFDLATNDDLTIENELASMTPDQRAQQAMLLLLYGRYQGQGTSANAKLDNNMLYSYLASTLNSWAANNIRGVDLTFGVNQYDRSVNGATSTTTSYSYQVSKSLFNNRFKILVGGNYSTDASAEDNLAQNLVSDISFEYILRQTQTMNMSVQLFRHQGYESILEGEITEMGVGFVMKRKLDNLKSLFNFRGRKKEKNDKKESTDKGIDVDTTENKEIEKK